MPFTQEQFFQTFADYNAAFWPLAILASILGLAALGLATRPSRIATAVIAAILALMWLVNGVGYHWSFFATINPAARIFGAAFVLEALLLAATPFLTRGFRIAPARDARTVVGLALAVYALAIYPVVGWLAGHTWPAMPAFGIAPCPTVIFTIGLLLLGEWRVSRWLLVIPALWGIVGGSAALLLHVPQDYGLIAALVAVLAFWVVSWFGTPANRHAT